MKKKITYILGAIVAILIVIIIVLILNNQKYVVTFDMQNGEPKFEQRVKKGNTAYEPSAPKKEGYVFLGWYYNGEIFDFNTPVTNNMTLIAGWEGIKVKYTVRFENEGEVKTYTVEKDGLVIEPNEPTKEGYVFLGWYLNDNKFDFNTPITKNIVLKAKFVAHEVQIYEVSFNTDGGSSVKTQKVEKDAKATKPSNPTKKGYKFDDWYLNDKKFDFNTKITADITLTAKWVKAYQVTFDSNGGSKIKSQEVAERLKVTKPSNPTKAGYKFDGWYLDDKKFDFNTKITTDITLTAKWVKAYQVTFDSNGGSKIKSQEVAERLKVTKPSNPTKAGYKFDGWYLDDKKFDFNTKITTDITLTAKWVKAYQVTFDSNGGSKIKSQEVAERLKVTKPSNPTKAGYKFDGWYLDDKKFDFNTKITTDITLTAKWTELEKYTVTFDTDGGSEISSKEVNEGEKVAKPSNPTKAGYVFKEWQLNGKTYDFNTSVTKNIKLVAVWEEVAKNYTFKVSLVDDYSPDRVITVYADGKEISFKYIKIDGVTLCSGKNPTVNKSEIDGITSITVVLNDDRSVTAKKS